MKRIVALFFAAIMLMAFSLPALAEAKTTVTFALWDENQKPMFDEIIAKFQEENPGIEVEVQLTPWSQYWT